MTPSKIQYIDNILFAILQIKLRKRFRKRERNNRLKPFVGADLVTGTDRGGRVGIAGFRFGYTAGNEPVILSARIKMKAGRNAFHVFSPLFGFRTTGFFSSLDLFIGTR